MTAGAEGQCQGPGCGEGCSLCHWVNPGPSGPRQPQGLQDPMLTGWDCSHPQEDVQNPGRVEGFLGLQGPMCVTPNKSCDPPGP